MFGLRLLAVLVAVGLSTSKPMDPQSMMPFDSKEEFELYAFNKGGEKRLTVINKEGEHTVRFSEGFEVEKPANESVCLIRAMVEGPLADSECIERLPLRKDEVPESVLEDCRDMPIFAVEPCARRPEEEKMEQELLEEEWENQQRKKEKEEKGKGESRNSSDEEAQSSEQGDRQSYGRDSSNEEETDETEGNEREFLEQEDDGDEQGENNLAGEANPNGETEENDLGLPEANHNNETEETEDNDWRLYEQEQDGNEPQDNLESENDETGEDQYEGNEEEGEPFEYGGGDFLGGGDGTLLGKRSVDAYRVDDLLLEKIDERAADLDFHDNVEKRAVMLSSWKNSVAGKFAKRAAMQGSLDRVLSRK